MLPPEPQRNETQPNEPQPNEPQPNQTQPNETQPSQTQPNDSAADGPAEESDRVAGRGEGLRGGLADLDAGDRRLRLGLAFAAVILVSLGLGLLAGTCWGGAPEPPLEGLGLGTDERATGTPEEPGPEESEGGEAEPRGLDPEQQAFAERRERELAARQAEAEPGHTVPDFTDRALVRELAGSWRLDLGRGRRGYRVRFGADPVRTVHRQRFDVTLFDVVALGGGARGLPPYYTVLDLPDGKLLTFLDASGTFRLVLEDVRRESDGRLSWRGPGGERRYGVRTDEPSAWRFDGAESAPPSPEPRSASPSPEPSREPGGDEPGMRDRQVREEPAVGLRPPPSPVPEATTARLYDELERHLDDFALGLMEQDAGRVFDLWGGDPDLTTRAAVANLLSRYASLRVWTRLIDVEVASTEDGPQLRFEAVVTVQGARHGARSRRDVDLRDVRWRGRVALRNGRGVQLDPYPG